MVQYSEKKTLMSASYYMLNSVNKFYSYTCIRITNKREVLVLVLRKSEDYDSKDLDVVV